MYETLIWATDGSAGAEEALEEALALRELTGGRLVAVHCDHRLTASGSDDVREAIRKRVAGLAARGLPVELVIRHSHHEAADVVAAVALEQHAGAIVCGTRGLGAFAGAFLGSFTHRLLQVAPCTVVAVPARERSEGRRAAAGNRGHAQRL